MGVGTIDLTEEKGERIYLLKPLYPLSDDERGQTIRFVASNFEIHDISEDDIPNDFKDHPNDGYYFWNEERGFYRNENWEEPKPIFDPTRATFETAAQLEYIAAVNDIEL